MDKLRETIRPMDVVLAALLSAFGVFLMVGNIASDDGTRVDSTSWLIVPVFLLATLPVLFRRANLVAVILVTAAAMAVHVAAFGWMVRCGAGLPLALVLAYSAGKLIGDRTQSVIALALTIGVQVLVLVKDSAAGLEALALFGPLALVLWGAGLFVRSRSERRPVGSAAAVPAGV